MTMTQAQTDLMNERIADYCNAQNQSPRNTQYGFGDVYSPMPVKKGQRWQRIIRKGTTQTFVDVWVDRHTGMLAYGNWKAPSKNRQGVPYYRYNLLDDAAFATLMYRVLTERSFWLYEDEITRLCH